MFFEIHVSVKEAMYFIIANTCIIKIYPLYLLKFLFNENFLNENLLYFFLQIILFSSTFWPTFCVATLMPEQMLRYCNPVI